MVIGAFLVNPQRGRLVTLCAPAHLNMNKTTLEEATAKVTCEKACVRRESLIFVPIKSRAQCVRAGPGIIKEKSNSYLREPEQQRDESK